MPRQYRYGRMRLQIYNKMPYNAVQCENFFVILQLKTLNSHRYGLA